MQIRWIVLTCLAGGFFVPAEASAQHTDCMVMGDLVSCNTVDTSNQDGGAALGRGLADLINGINEKNFRKKIGKLLADGDCEGASRYALEKGRIEMGMAIRERCTQPQEQGGQASLNRRLEAVAAQAKTPVQYSDDLIISAVQARGSELWLVVQYGKAGAVPVEQRNSAMGEICTSEAMHPLLLSGAAIRTFYLSPEGGQIAQDRATAASCALQ